MNNNEWLSQYIDALNIVSDNRAVAAMSLDHKFLFTSRKYLELTETEEDVTGKHYFETSMPGQEYIDDFRKISDMVNDTGKTASFFLIYTSPKKKVKTCYFYTLSIVYNPSTKEPVARLGEIQPVMINFIGQMVNLSNKITSGAKDDSETQIDSFDKFKLTVREEEVIFLLMLGKTHKEIASTLSMIYKKEIAPATISSVISRQLYPKLNAYSLQTLISNAIRLQLIQEIPASLLQLTEGIFLLNYS